MIGSRSIIALGVLALLFCGCATVHTRVLTEATGIAGLEQVILRPVKIESGELNRDAIVINQQLNVFTVIRLQSLLAAKRITATTGVPAEIECQIAIVYGNRTRWSWLSGGAGSGHMQVTLRLKDNSVVRYATVSESDLDAGWFADDLASQARTTITAAINEFGSRL